MKKASNILSIIACVIGIIWSVVGFFVVWFGGAVVAAGQTSFAENVTGAEHTTDAAAMEMITLIGAFVMIILGMVFSAVGNSKSAGSAKTLINGALLLGCGVLAAVWHSYVSGPIYVFSGFLTCIAGAIATGTNKESRRPEPEI